MGSLLREIDLNKKKTNSELIKKQISGTHDINDTILLERFKKFKENPINYNGNDDDDNNSNNDGINPAGPAPPPSTFSNFPSFFPKPQPPPPPPPPQNFFSTSQLPTNTKQTKYF